MERELVNPGQRCLSVLWALIFLSIGLFFAIAGPFPYMILLVFPLFAYEFLGFLWNGFYRTPNRIRIINAGMNFSYRSRKNRFVPWQDVEKVEVPNANPTTLHGKYLATARVHIKGEKRPYNLTIEAGRTISAAYHERLSGHSSIKEEPAG